MAVCRDCYAKTLTQDERERFYAEPVTGCIFLCTEHQAVHDRLLASLAVHFRRSEFAARPIEDGAS